MEPLREMTDEFNRADKLRPYIKWPDEKESNFDTLEEKREACGEFDGRDDDDDEV